MACSFFGVINVISNVALKFGSSQQGNARRQSAGYKSNILNIFFFSKGNPFTENCVLAP